jgi:Tfp pilus assembly protein PilF
MGLRYVQLGDEAQARAAFEQALNVDPTYTPARDNLNQLGAG